MDTKRMIVNIHERIVDSSTGTDWDELRIQDYDITDIMLEVIGEDPEGTRVAEFIAEPWEFPEIGAMLSQDPDVDFHAELDPGFSLGEFLHLEHGSDDEECAHEWNRWRTGIIAQGDPHAWRRAKWAKRATEIASALKEDEGREVPSDVYLPMMRSLVGDPAMVRAFIDSLRGWEGEPLEGLRTIAAVVDGLQNGPKTD